MRSGHNACGTSHTVHFVTKLVGGIKLKVQLFGHFSKFLRIKSQKTLLSNHPKYNERNLRTLC